MNEILMEIDGKEVRAVEGQTVLEAAGKAGIFIPTLCFHEQLEPHGGCRLCLVELQSGNMTKHVASCVYPVEANVKIKTRSAKIDRVRRTLLELLSAHAPDSPNLLELVEEYGANRHRFEQEASFCVHCALCVRYCHEVKEKDAVGFIGRGTGKEIAFIPEIAAEECNHCRECFPLCPTSYLQAAFVLTQSLAFPNQETEGN